MATVPKTSFGLTSHESGKRTEDERRDRIKSAGGAVLALMVIAGPVWGLVLVVLSALVSLSG